MPQIFIPSEETGDLNRKRGAASPSAKLGESVSRKGLLQSQGEVEAGEDGDEGTSFGAGSKESASSRKTMSGYSELSDALSPLPFEAKSPLRSPLHTLSSPFRKSPLASPLKNSEHQGSPFRSPRRSPLGGSPRRSPISTFLTPSATFHRLTEAKEEVSRMTPSELPSFSSRIKDGIHMLGNIDWKIVQQQVREWLWNPKNLALLLWILAVAVSGALLFMVMTGMLNRELPRKKDRDAWFEVNNQILNALFTLMCLYLHPTRFYHAFLLYRWEPRDVIKMRKLYCKNGTRKLNEWFHMLVVVVLLQLNCFGQYALCGLNWGYKRSDRPAIGVAICLVFAIGCSAAAGIYNSLSPLGKEFVAVDDNELSMFSGEGLDGVESSASMRPETSLYDIGFMKFRLLEKRMSFAHRDGGRELEHPVWKGGLWDWNMEPGISIVSTLCGVCVFGWNMDRLGFGNRYVHILTFVLLLTAPFWIFDLAAINIDNYYVRQSIGGAGIALSVFGLLYGGFWRIRMRETFNLPAKTWCCGNARMTDCTQWLFCSICSLCQEVRTAEAYDIRDDKFFVRVSGKFGGGLSYRMPGDGGGSNSQSPRPGPLSPLPPPVEELSLNGSSSSLIAPTHQTVTRDVQLSTTTTILDVV